MESFALRGVRTTVAVAGLAALGVGLAAPAFAAPGVPDVSGVGSTQPAADHFGTPTGPANAPDALGALPGAFAFQPPAAEQSAPSDAAPADAAPSPSAEEAQTDSTEAASDESEATASDTTDAAPGLVSAQPQIIYIDTPHDGFGPMGEIQPR